MNKEIAIFTALFFSLLLVQVLICNHIALFNLAVPFIFIYFILRLPIGLNSNLLFTLAFAMGLCVDLFSDTPGLNSLCCTLLALAKKPCFYAYVTHDDKTADIMPAVSTLGWAVYSKFLITCTTLYCLLLFSIDYFSFASVKDIAIMAVASSLLTFLLILAADSLFMPRRERL